MGPRDATVSLNDKDDDFGFPSTNSTSVIVEVARLGENMVSDIPISPSGTQAGPIFKRTAVRKRTYSVELDNASG